MQARFAITAMQLRDKHFVYNFGDFLSIDLKGIFNRGTTESLVLLFWSRE